MCLEEGLISFSALPYAFTWSLGKLQPVSFMPSTALAQHCLVWRVGMRAAQDLTWRVTETHLSTWWMSHPVLSSLSSRLSQCSTWKIQWKELQLWSRQTSSINQKRSHTAACVPRGWYLHPFKDNIHSIKWSFFFCERELMHQRLALNSWSLNLSLLSHVIVLLLF